MTGDDRVIRRADLKADRGKHRSVRKNGQTAWPSGGEEGCHGGARTHHQPDVQRANAMRQAPHLDSRRRGRMGKVREGVFGALEKTFGPHQMAMTARVQGKRYKQEKKIR